MMDLDALERMAEKSRGSFIEPWSGKTIQNGPCPSADELAALVRIARDACIYRDDFSDRAWDALIDALREAGL